MSFLLVDAALVVIMLICIIIGIKKGAVKIIFTLLSLILAAYLAFLLSTPAARIINSTFFEPKIVNAVESSINGSAESIVEALPDFVVKNSVKFGLDLNNTQIIDANNFVDESISPIIIETVSGILMFILFIILTVLFGFIVKIINKIVKISFLGKFNKLLGALFGFANGLIFVALATVLIRETFSLSGKGLWFIPEAVLNKTFIYNFFDNLF